MSRRQLMSGGAALGFVLGLAVLLALRLAPEPRPAGGQEIGARTPQERARLPAASGDRSPPRFRASAPASLAAAAAPELPTSMDEALLRFGVEQLPTVDSCLGPPPGPRSPRPVRVSLRRERAEPPSADAVVFVVDQARGEPAIGPGAPSQDLQRCLARLAGRRVVLPRGAAPSDDRVERFIDLFLPAPMGAAPDPTTRTTNGKGA